MRYETSITNSLGIKVTVTVDIPDEKIHGIEISDIVLDSGFKTSKRVAYRARDLFNRMGVSINAYTATLPDRIKEERYVTFTKGNPS